MSIFNPFGVEIRDSESRNQAAFFSWMRMFAYWGLKAADDEQSYTVKNHAALVRDARLVGLQLVNHASIAPALRSAFAVPNGAEMKSAVSAAKMIAEGLTPGIPDVMIPLPGRTKAGLFLEFKSQKGVVSDAQKARISDLESLNYECAIVVGWRAARETLINYIKKETGIAL